jgi:TonB family protein
MRFLGWVAVLGILLLPAAALGGPTRGNEYARIRANDAPIAGRFSIYGYFLDSLDVSLPLPGPGRLLALNFREASGENAFLVPGDLAVEGDAGSRWRGGFLPLGEERLGGRLEKTASRWALWWIPWGEDTLQWNAAADLHLVYGFSKSLFVPLDAKDTQRTLEAIPWDQLVGVRIEPGRGTADPEGSIDAAAYDQFPQVKERKNPVYPRSARLYSFDGSVHVVAEVDAGGRVTDAWVLHSDAVHDLNVAALDAVMQWTFRPGTKDGKPVAGEMVIPVRFSSGWTE